MNLHSMENARLPQSRSSPFSPGYRNFAPSNYSSLSEQPFCVGQFGPGDSPRAFLGLIWNGFISETQTQKMSYGNISLRPFAFSRSSVFRAPESSSGNSLTMHGPIATGFLTCDGLPRL